MNKQAKASVDRLISALADQATETIQKGESTPVVAIDALSHLLEAYGNQASGGTTAIGFSAPSNDEDEP
ncbi:hypothetical protein [Cohnella abietis]|uniref:Uncharacterized protein n=1 Tax=Cohnella abietis TaxID=2507935 RepID=A0A3T1D1N6_9BACL|nr:hypothetical protein [Cohnella abietis]BBI32032.1 hypothetical protein KCTCHS21_14310 [Cohnella abietis]